MRTLTLIALVALTGCSEFFGNKPETVAAHPDIKACVEWMQKQSNHYLGATYWGAELSQKKLTEGCEWRLQEGQSLLTIQTKRHRADDWR